MRLGPRVLAFLALTYALLLGGHVYLGDELMMARVTEAIVTRGELAVQSVQVNFIDYTYAAWKSTDDIEATVRWSWEWSPLLRYWDFPVKDFILLPRLLRGEGGAFLAAFAWTLVAGWVASVASLGRALARRDYQ
jgi:hypothetical protein